MFTIDPQTLAIAWDASDIAKAREMIDGGIPKAQIERGLDTLFNRLYAIHAGGKKDDLWRDFASLSREDQEAVKADVQRRKEKDAGRS